MGRSGPGAASLRFVAGAAAVCTAFAAASMEARVAAAPLLSSAQYPSNLQFDAVSAGPGGLQLSGSATVEGNSGVDCLTAQVNPVTLALSHLIEPRCDDPRLSGEPVMAVSQPLPGGMSDDVRIARLVPGTGQVRLGPVIAAYEEGSDTHLESTVANGSLWLYMAAPLGSHNRSEVLQVSEATGEVLRKALLPWVLTRPVISAGAQALFIAYSLESGYSNSGANSRVTIFRVASGSGTVQPWFRSGAGGPGQGVFVNWAVADGPSLWAELCRHLGASNSCHILRFDGAAATPVMTSGVTAQTDDWAIVDGTSGIFSSLFPTAITTTGAPVPTTIVKFDPATGKETKLASLLMPGYWGDLDYDGNPEAAVYGAALYLLAPPGQVASAVGGAGATPGVLYRLPIGRAS